MTTYTVDNLNPRSQAVKTNEMAVLRALQFIDLFDEWVDEVRDWRDIVTATPSSFRRIYGDDHNRLQPVMEIDALWDRYKDGTIYRQVLDLAENVPLDSLAKSREKEIRDGLRKCREKLPD